MKDIYRQILKQGIIWGALAGLTIILLFYIKRAIGIPGLVLVFLNFTIVVIYMVVSIFYQRRKVGEIGFPISRELAFLVYIIAIIILMVFRFAEGYFYKFSLPAILFGLILIYELGRGMSYLIGKSIVKLVSKN